MKSIVKLIADLIQKMLVYKKYRLGALENPSDPRNISLASIQNNIDLPDEYQSELSPVKDQGNIPKCVGSAISRVAEVLLKEEDKEYEALSDDDLYRQCKLMDYMPNIGGTYPIIGAKVITKNGISTDEIYKNGSEEEKAKSREKNKLDGYAFVDANYFAICQAIYQNKLATASFAIDKNWFIGKIMRVLTATGRHYVVLHGFNTPYLRLYGSNSWGVDWIGYIAGKINRKVKKGNFELYWPDYQDNIRDIMVFTHIPDDVKEEIKNARYKFNSTMRYGSKGYEVRKLQERLNDDGYTPELSIDGEFGRKTEYQVKVFQRQNNLVADGVVGKITRRILNGKMELVDAIIQVESGGDDYARGDLHLAEKAYGCMQIRQPCVTDVNRANGTHYRAEDMLGNRELSIWVFERYMDIYAKGQSDEYKARVWNGGPNGWRYESTVKYWEKVRKLLIN